MSNKQTLEISQIIRESKYQVRSSSDQRTITKYRKVLLSGSKMPPITVAKVEDSYFLVDGWHRLAALEQTDHGGTVEAEVVDATQREVYWLAAKANLTHGLPLKSKEIRSVFRAYISARKHLDGERTRPYREIAQDIGGLNSHMTIRRWMIKDFPKIAQRMGGEAGHAEGGQRSHHSDEETWVSAAARELDNVRARFNGNPKDKSGRTALLEHLHEMVTEIEVEMRWTESAF
jgi:hypothetical protein